MRHLLRQLISAIQCGHARTTFPQTVKKGGKVEETVGRSCLCNNLGATAGFPQRRKDGYVEKPLITTGDDLVMAGQYVPAGKTTYSAKDVIDYLLSGLRPDQMLGTA